MTLPSWLLLITMPLGVARATWLVMNDRLLETPRHWFEHRGGYLAYFIQCPWCVSMWVAGISCALTAWDFTRPLMSWLFVLGALSIFAVLFERTIDRTPMLMDDAPFPSLPTHEAEVLSQLPPEKVADALAQKE